MSGSVSEEDLRPYKERLMGLIPTDRIVTVSFSRPSKAVVEGFKALPEPTPTIADVLDSMGIAGIIASADIAPIATGQQVVGPAVTLRYIPERNSVTQSFLDKAKAKLADRDAYAVAEPGDVVVIDAGGQGTVSCCGDLSATAAVARGIAGNIIDGGCRDVGHIRRIGLPVWSRGITPRTGKYRLEAAEINGPVTIAGVQVRPGDLIVADDSGIVVIPVEKAAEVLQKVRETIEKEDKVVDAVRRGATVAELQRILDPSKW